MKRIIGMMVFCFMVFAMLPANAVADTGNVYVVSGSESGEYVTGILQAGQDVEIVSGGEVTGTITVPADRTLTLDGGTITGGTNSGVVVNGGTFTMNDGTISGNEAGIGTWGGGVRVQNSGTFTMYDGIIRNNYSRMGGGVAVRDANATFEMHGGTIVSNTAYGDANAERIVGRGGGVQIVGAATFRMTGGTIKANRAGTGGGVNVESAYGTFYMEGGYIRNHDITGHGGGVNNAGSFEMTGGVISGNTANRGGGVNMQGNGNTFSMYDDAEISDNTASVEGGGVAIFLGTFLMDGGTIEDNTANNGGGMWISASDVTIDGGTIYNNEAHLIGGGIVIQNAASSLDINAGTISGNRAENGGGIGFLLSAPEPTEDDFQEFLDVVTIKNEAKFTGNKAAAERIHERLNAANEHQIAPGIVSLISAGHAFTNYDIHVPFAECCDDYPDCDCCPDCGNYPCDCPCCDEYPNCDCCPDCGNYPCDCYGFYIIFHMYDGSGIYVVVGVNLGDTLDLVALADLDIPVNHIYGTLDAPGFALWGWFDADTLATGIGRSDLDAQGQRDGFRRPAVGSVGFDLTAEITQAMIDNLFDAYGNLDLFVVWSPWGDADDNDEVTSFDVTLIDRWVFDRWMEDMGETAYFNATLNYAAAKVTLGSTITSADSNRILQWLFDRWLESMGEPPHFNAVLGG